MVRWSRALASLLVLVAFGASTWATCVEGATATATRQMACCKAGHDHCPMHDSASDCCKKSGPPVESQGTIVKAASLSAPVPVVLAWVILPTAVSAVHVQRHISYDSSPPDLLHAPPPYIAFSGLLI
jgi:hypothetical protein